LTAPFKSLAGCLALALAPIATATEVAAHPHVFVDAKASIVFDDQGRIDAVRNVWEFDEAFTAFAIQGLDTNGDGKLAAAELASLAQVNMDSLKDYDYFTYVVAGPAKHVFAAPTKYWLELHDSRLTLFFTLPLKDPVAVDGTATVEVFDPEYFVAFTFVKSHPVSLEGAPPGCTATYQPPHELDAGTMSALAAIPLEQHDLPPALLNAASALASVIQVNCPASAVTVAQAALTPPTPRLSPLDFSQAASAPATVVPTSAPAPPPTPEPPAPMVPAAPAAADAPAVPETAEADQPVVIADGNTQPSPAPDDRAQASVPKSGSTAAVAGAERGGAPAAAVLGPAGLIGAFATLLIAAGVCGLFLLRRVRRAQ
jgi:ABC-type uncharacterized transport system substrate-binding protein